VREPPATIGKGEIAVASREELHAARLSGKRLLALWNALPGVEQQAKLGDRNTLSIDCGQRSRRRPTRPKIYRANCTRIVTGAYGEPRNSKSRRELRG
jgi:hypothetical protein